MKPLGLVVLVSALTLQTFGAETSPVTPVHRDGALILFSAVRHAPGVFRNYTASWKKGSNLVPATQPMTKGGDAFVEFSYVGEQGTAISLLRLEHLPHPPIDTRYSGVRLVIDYEKDDYRSVSIQSSFSDKTTLTSRLVLEQGTHEYLISDGFRRARHPPDWNRLDWVWLAVSSSRDKDNRSLIFGLKEITVMQKETRQTALRTVTFGDRVFCPEPRRIEWTKGDLSARKLACIHMPSSASARTRRTAAIFRDSFLRHTGRKLAMEFFDGAIPDRGVVLRTSDAIVRDGATVGLRPEGYHLVVERERVVVTGADEPGLYYGGVTFFQLMKNSMRITDTRTVPGVDILDWPDLSNRLCRLEHPSHFKHGTLKENRGIDYLIEWTERFVAGNKLNVFFIDLSANTIYERRPECNGNQRSYSLADLKRFGKFCRDRFIDLCPAWQVGGHANWWLTYGYHPELVESGWSHAQADVTHPDHDKIVTDCMLDVIEALQPKYASPKSDEWWHHRAPDKPLADLLHGKTRAQAFLDLHLKLNAWLKARGVTMMMYHDMLTPFHNGTRFDLYKIADKMPKDAVILHWSSPVDIPKWFAKKGFTTWMNPTGIRLVPEELERYVTGYGKGMYSFGGSRKMPSELRGTSNMYAFHQGADHAWNLSRDPRVSWEDGVRSGRWVAVRNLFAVRPNPCADATIRPLDIRDRMNHSFARFLKEARPEEYAKHDQPAGWRSGTREIGFVPTHFPPDESRNCIVLQKNDPDVSIPIGGRYSSLIFLHTAHLRSRDGIKPTTYRSWPYGFPCGDYVVCYEDGARTVLPLRFEHNIRRFDVPVENRATNDNRYVHTFKDANGGDIHVFQWEWVNPLPDRRIVSIEVRHDDELDVSLVLLAMSGRSIAEAPR